jgi:hypothetical protein
LAYIKDTKYAVEGLISLATSEEKLLIELERDLKKAELLAQELYNKFYNEDLSDFTSDSMVQRSYQIAMEAQFRKQGLDNKVKELRESVSNKQESIRSLCQAILQIASQGICVVHGKEKVTCPPGRLVYEIPLKTIIWDARDQSIHCEEGKFNKFVENCFDKLEAALGDKLPFRKQPTTNYAKEIVWLLGWNEYAQYESDMVSLLYSSVK